METNIKPGIKNILEKTVVFQDTAKSMKSGSLEVFATPALVAFMEETAMQSVEDKLPMGSTTVGTEINLTHIKATKKGCKVRCETTLIMARGRELEFEIVAFDQKNLIGKAYHKRVIIDIERFLSKLEDC